MLKRHFREFSVLGVLLSVLAMLGIFAPDFFAPQPLLSRLTARDFVRIRLIRLYPMAALGISIGIMSLLARHEIVGDISLGAILAALIFGAMMLPLPRLQSGGNAFPIDPPLWSISYEIMINIVFAAVVRHISHGLLKLICLVSMIMEILVCYFKDHLLLSDLLVCNSLADLSRILLTKKSNRDNV